MVFKSIFGKGEDVDDEDQFVEVETTATGERPLVTVRIEELTDFKDVEVVQKIVRSGSIVFLKIKTLRDKNLGELKRSVQKLQKGSMAMNGDIVGVDDNFLVICPQGARVFRGDAVQQQ